MNDARITVPVTSTSASTFMPVVHRSCGGGRIAGSSGECDERRWSGVARRPTSTGRAEHAGLPPAVDAVLRSPGQRLETTSREILESRFGHDFGQVRIHHDVEAAVSARAVDALAYTVGEDIVFEAGQYAPGTAAGRRLLAHELTHVLQQRRGAAGARVAEDAASTAEREAGEVASRVLDAPASTDPVRVRSVGRGLLRQPATAAAAQPAGMTRREFEEVMKRRFGVIRIATGTLQEQATLLMPRGGAPPGGIQLPNWSAWDPGNDSPTYGWIIEAFERFNVDIGGVPPVQEILFFESHYDVNQAGTAIPRPDVGASFGAGHLTIYRAVSREQPLPIGRSEAKGRYPGVVVVVTGIPGQSPGAPLPLPMREENVRRAITHELGHGLAEAAMGPNPAQALDPYMMADYRTAVGWTRTDPAHLFDIGVPAVVHALQTGTPPPPTAEITEDNWNSPRWIEQPLTHYSVKGGPSEDFAEAVMAYIAQPTLLLARSRQRFRFLESRKDLWLPRLLHVPQVGDFPMPRGKARVA